MQRNFLQSGLFAFSLSVLLSSILFAQSKQPPAQRWEYRTIGCNEIELSKLGDEGWELTSVVHYSGSCNNYLLKRLKPANAPKYIDPNEQPKPTPTSPACQLTLAQSPKFRGIRLGMNLQEVLSLFPGSEANLEVKASLEMAKKPDIQPGYTSFGFNAKTYENVKEAKELFAGVNAYSFQFFDDRLIRFYVSFSEHRADFNWGWTLDAWEKKLAEAFNLPLSKEWGNSERMYGNSSGLQCNGFFIEASIGGRFSNFSVRATPTSSIDDQIKQRKEKAVEQIRQEFKINP